MDLQADAAFSLRIPGEVLEVSPDVLLAWGWGWFLETF